MGVTSLSSDAFQSKVVDSKGTVFVDFYAEWCGPCKLTGPIIDALANEYPGITFYKVDVDQNSDLASSYSIFSIPTFVIFKDGQVVTQFSGATSKEGFVAEIQKATS